MNQINFFHHIRCYSTLNKKIQAKYDDIYLRRMASSSVAPPQPPSVDQFHDVYSEANRLRTISALEDPGKDSIAARIAQYAASKLIKKRAAVLIPLTRNSLGEPSILYTLRNLKLRKHGGEISFPGGSQDPEDENEIVTALRETEEELNISKDRIHIWKVLEVMPTASTLMGVTPIVGFIDENLDGDKLVVNEDEVEKAFTITLKHLCSPQNWGHTQHIKGMPIPMYKNLKIYHKTHYSKPELLSSSSSEDDEDASSKPYEVKLWGLTALLTHIVLKALLPQVYTRHI